MQRTILPVCLYFVVMLAQVGPTEPGSTELWTKYRTTPLLRVSGTQAYFFITNDIAIDADGAPNAYHPDDIGLDLLANAGYPESSWWQNVLVIDPTNSKRPYRQESGAFSGYFVSRTALENRSKAETDSSRYVDATRIPYLVFPGAFYNMAGTGILGDLGIAINLSSGERTAFVVADLGPKDAQLGEVSIRLAEKLGGKNISPRNGAGAPKGPFLYMLFPYSGRQYRWPLSAEDIEQRAQELWSKTWK